VWNNINVTFKHLTAVNRKLHLLAMKLAVASSRWMLTVYIFYLYYQVGDVMETEFSGFSVPLEHSFEVGEDLLFLISWFIVIANAGKLKLAVQR